MADITAYDLYMKNLSKIKRLTNAEQRQLQKEATHSQAVVRGDAAQKLQGQALLLVAYVFKRMQANDRLLTVESFDMDAIQEANLAALSALPSWDPVRGTLATWLVPHIKGALLDYANTHTNGGIGSKHNKLIQVAIDEVVASEELLGAPDDNPFAETTESITLEESLTYENDVIPNQEREALLAQIQEYAWLIRNGDMLMLHYLQDQSIKDLAYRYNTSQDTVRRMMDRALDDLRRHIEVGDHYSCGIC